MFLQKYKVTILISFLTLIGALLHFYNLNWGSPFYFHPDERNIASSASQLQFPNKMNPHFFAYGSLPIYTIYFTGVIINFFTKLPIFHVQFEHAILISRFYSAIFATLLIPILFLIGKKLRDEKTGLLAAFLVTTSVGLIQFSHFGTFEMWLTFFSVLLFWLCIEKIDYKNIFLIGIVFGILISIKISSISVLLIPLSVILLKNFKRDYKTNLSNILKKAFIFLFIVTTVYGATNPFVFLDTKSFIESINYESSVVFGTLPVFYTGEFFRTIPIIFQFINIYPFLLNPLITILFIPTFTYLCWKSIKTKNQSYIILNAFYIILFFPQAFLFAKWTRYMVPALPFVYLIVAVALSHLSFRTKLRSLVSQRFLRSLRSVGMTLIWAFFIGINTLFAISYFMTVFTQQDTRITAKEFAIKNISSNARILSEVYDLGIVPFNSYFPDITLFNFYDLDPTLPLTSRGVNNLTPELITDLRKSDFIILPSQRILKTRVLDKKQFPKGETFYEQLLNGDLGFQKIYETPCDIFCKVTYLVDPIFRFEQTVNVFDRPTLFIFKKDK